MTRNENKDPTACGVLLARVGCLTFGPMIATHRFFGTLNRVEQKLNEG